MTCLAQGWFSKLKKSVSSVSTVRVYHSTATISHGSDIPTNDVDWWIVALLKQRRLKLWKVCRLIRASTQTSVQLVPDVLNWRKIWRHRRPFHYINVVCRQELSCGTCGMGVSIILLKYCHTITCLHEWQNHWGKNVVSVFLGIKGTIYSHKLSFPIVRNSTPYHHRTAPKMICLNNACVSVTLSCTVENTRSSISMLQRKTRLICIQNLSPLSCVPVLTIPAPGQTCLLMASR